MKRVIRFQMEGKTYEVQVDRSGDELTVEGEGQSYRVSLLGEEGGGPVPAAPRASQPAATVRTEAAAPAARPAAARPAAAPVASSPAAGDGGVLFAPMTGVVKDIRVSVGHNVQKGQVVLVMEARKMDIDVPAPAAGVVAPSSSCW